MPRARSVASILIVGALAILAFDTLGALASQSIGFPYGALAPGSYAIYSIVGILAVKKSSLWTAALVSGFVGAIDATWGWAISSAIGPGRPEQPVPAIGILFTAIFVAVTAAVVGFLASWVYLKVRRRQRAPGESGSAA